MWKAAESHGGAAKTYGKCHGIWNLRRHMGRPPGRMGSQKSHQNPEYGNGGGPRALHVFHEFLAGGGGPAFAAVKASHRACCERRGA